MNSNKDFFALGLGLGTKNQKGEWIEVYYPLPLYLPKNELMTQIAAIVGYSTGNKFYNLGGVQSEQVFSLLHKKIQLPEHLLEHEHEIASSKNLLLLLLENDAQPESVPEAYFKLQLLSHRLVKPHEINLSGIFSVLPNIAWTNQGAIDLAELPSRQLTARLKGEVLDVFSVDKFPKMTDYIVPSGVRIADTARVRLGAYLGEGTTIMHEGFVNFNAGTIGPNMIEGRISAGVMVEGGSDLGGGCSTMGTLSGGNAVVISVGKDCLIGANAGLGIPLGDRCTIEAGLYVTGSSKVALLDEKGEKSAVTKAAELAGKSDLLFRRNSLTGALECKTNKSAIQLNEELHSNN